MPVISAPVDGIDLRYDVAGAGPAVVLLHGSVLSRAIWRGLGYLGPLAEHHTVIRVDLRGHGSSGTPHDAEAYTQERFVRDLLAVLDAEQLPRASLVGYSLGARIALTTAVQHPDRVDALVSLGGSASPQRGAGDEVFFPGVIDAVATGGMEQFCARQSLGPDVEERRARATRAAFLRAVHEAVSALLAATDATAGIDPELLAECEVPALWMAGTEDHPRFEESRQAAAVMPRPRFVPLEGRDHGGSLFPPGPVLEHVLPFLQEELAG
ncbi:alpha/beta fold hydrolase [Brachybacterium muris]|uniref:Alpha/beta hydrolase n=1 Tax=Brachybacterium muris UCD-AY4 TaxID=1249481 RepID=A0A022KY13_9MICO|nr:alpha/beta hydrolase [Brachybacterium muris]EYT51225.1 alpha/beta hydrolase [Brachybacterium muris UCD-AY4]MCT1655224.1 alpha/beta fold hydrolase [Brachybacterium muris]